MRSRISVIRVLITVWVIFLLCWTPLFLLVLVREYARNWLFSAIRVYTYNNTIILLQTITIFNSCINPFLYAFMSK